MVKKLHTAGLFFAVAALLGQQRIGQAPFYKDRQNLLVYLDDSGNSHSVGTVGEWEIRRSHIIHSLQLVMGPLPEPEASSLNSALPAVGC